MKVFSNGKADEEIKPEFAMYFFCLSDEIIMQLKF